MVVKTAEMLVELGYLTAVLKERMWGEEKVAWKAGKMVV